MLAILNLDFAVGTTIVVSCLESGENPKRQNGRAKNWEELLDTLKKFYSNRTMISDITSLHDLRNSIQHGDTIPSDWDIVKYEQTVRRFFDDVCNQIFKGKITYDAISLALVLKSPHETELMLQAEDYISRGCYSNALYIIHIVVIYHYMLIKSNLLLPMLPRYEFYSSPRFTKGNVTEVDNDILDLYTMLDKAVDQLAIGEYYSRMQEVLKNANPHLSFRYSYHWISKLRPPTTVMPEDVEAARDSVYSIILGTENLITEKLIVGVPIVYDLKVYEITKNSATVKYSIMSKLDIDECVLKVYRDNEMKELETSISLPKKKGHQEWKIDGLQSGHTYVLKIEVTQEGDPEYQGNKHLNYADTTITTL